MNGSQAWVWKSFTRGYNVLFMDPYDGDVLGQLLGVQAREHAALQLGRAGLQDEVADAAVAGAPGVDLDPAQPVLALDVWEHAYYIDYRNRRPDYLKAFVDHMVNWEYVAELLKGK